MEDLQSSGLYLSDLSMHDGSRFLAMQGTQRLSEIEFACDRVIFSRYSSDSLHCHDLEAPFHRLSLRSISFITTIFITINVVRLIFRVFVNIFKS